MSEQQPWLNQPLLQDKTIVVTGCSSGIGWETARIAKAMGATVIGVDRNRTDDHIDELYIADMSDERMVQALISALPTRIDGLANIAGLPPTASADKVLKVNFLALKRLTENLVVKMNDGASIVNLASLAGFGWQHSVPAVKEFINIGFNEVDDFIRTHEVGNEGGRSYFFSKEALVVWTFQNRWTWRDRGIRMNSVSPGPVDTPIMKDFVQTLGKRAEEDMRVMDRPGTAQDIAPIVAFLLSDMTTWLRGANITSDGGMSSHLLSEIHEL